MNSEVFYYNNGAPNDINSGFTISDALKLSNFFDCELTQIAKKNKLGTCYKGTNF
jgi:hypothetical protein